MKTKYNKIQRTTLTRPLTKKSELNRVLKSLIETHESLGIITLKEFIKQTDCPPQVAVDFLRKTRKGDFIEGRRGHPSRFVFGEAQEKWIYQELRRAEWRERNGRDPLTGRLLDSGKRPYVHRLPFVPKSVGRHTVPA